MAKKIKTGAAKGDSKSDAAVPAPQKRQAPAGKVGKKAQRKLEKVRAPVIAKKKKSTLKAPKTAPKSTTKPMGLHFEVERGYSITPEKYASLGPKLLADGFKLESVCVIVDTLLPTEKKGDTHRLRRMQYIGRRKPVVEFMHEYKSHPKMSKGNHVRLEQPPTYISAAEADGLITRYTNETCASLPVYSKTRSSYVKMWKRRKLTIALDLALGLGQFSGHNIELEVLIPVQESSGEEVQRVIDKYVDEIEEIENKIEKFAQKLLGEKLEPKLSYRKQRKRTWGIGGVGEN